jgi:hypothetical protein
LLDRGQMYVNDKRVTDGSVKRMMDLVELRDWRS